MGVRRSGSAGSRGNAGVLKERANMSFMFVVMFFAVFGLIVLTEIFLIDERRSNGGGTGALGGHRNGHRLAAAPDRPDYEEVGVSLYLFEGLFVLFFSTNTMATKNNSASSARKENGTKLQRRVADTVASRTSRRDTILGALTCIIALCRVCRRIIHPS